MNINFCVEVRANVEVLIKSVASCVNNLKTFCVRAMLAFTLFTYKTMNSVHTAGIMRVLSYVVVLGFLLL